MIRRFVILSQRLKKNLSADLPRFGRPMSTFNTNGREEATVVSEDGQIIVCWHPEPKFPYEFTKPIPEYVDTNPLKVDNDEASKVFYKTHPYFERKMLQDLTFTEKRLWFPRRKDKFMKFKEQEPRDREYL